MSDLTFPVNDVSASVKSTVVLSFFPCGDSAYKCLFMRQALSFMLPLGTWSKGVFL